MRYGFYLPTRGPTATRDGILALAREGERLGLHSAMVADHIVFPVESQSTYPYTVDGRHPSVGDALETFSILGVVFTVCESNKKLKNWVPSPTGVGIGMLVPFAVISTMFIGGIIGWIWERTDKKTADTYMVPLASGLIAGEAIVAVVGAIYFAVTG